MCGSVLIGSHELSKLLVQKAAPRPARGRVGKLWDFRPRFRRTELKQSKKMDLIKWSGSAPIDWVEWFELEVHQQEIYWVLEIDFNKRKISKIKPLLKASTSEVLKMVNDEFKIRVEDEQGRLKYMKKELNKYKIESTLHKLKRSRNNNG